MDRIDQITKLLQVDIHRFTSTMTGIDIRNDQFHRGRPQAGDEVASESFKTLLRVTFSFMHFYLPLIKTLSTQRRIRSDVKRTTSRSARSRFARRGFSKANRFELLPCRFALVDLSPCRLVAAIAQAATNTITPAALDQTLLHARSSFVLLLFLPLPPPCCRFEKPIRQDCDGIKSMSPLTVNCCFWHS